MPRYGPTFHAAPPVITVIGIQIGAVSFVDEGIEPVLDILQSIPVLGFLPSLIIAFITLFPASNVGLELAAVVMIFTGQVWNMTFSFYHSLQSIPRDFQEVATLGGRTERTGRGHRGGSTRRIERGTRKDQIRLVFLKRNIAMLRRELFLLLSFLPELTRT